MIFGTPPIITNGLVLNLDAINQRSYTSGSTKWLDIPNTALSASLNGGPAFSRIGGVSINFDGTDDHADFFAPNLGTITTVEMFCNIRSTNNSMFFGWNTYDVFTYIGAVGYNTSNSELYGISSGTVTALGLLNNWHHYIFEMQSDVSTTNNKIYIDAKQQILGFQLGSTDSAANRNFNSGNGRISGWRIDNQYRMPMNCAIFRVYNRALTSSEVQQNYNALKSRFNLS